MTQVRPLTLRILGPRTVRRGLRAGFAYRVRNVTSTPIRGVVVVNTLPGGLGIDRLSRRVNLRVRNRALRFTGAGRTATFRIGTVGAGRTVVLRVNAKVAATARRGRTTNTVSVRGTGVPRVKATAAVTVR